MARTKSEMLSSVGRFYEICKVIVDEVKNQGGTDEDVSRILTDHQVRRGMVGLLLKKAKSAALATFHSIVNYDRSVALGIQAGNYNWINDYITDKNFPPEKGESGTKEISFELVHLNKVVSSEQALQELESRNLRPATLRELLAFGEKYPDEQRKYSIVALGSVGRYWDGRGVPCLYGGGRERRLSLARYGGGWYSDCRFLAVRK